MLLSVKKILGTSALQEDLNGKERWGMVLQDAGTKYPLTFLILLKSTLDIVAWVLTSNMPFYSSRCQVSAPPRGIVKNRVALHIARFVSAEFGFFNL